ncbi:hypothetical protein L1987_25476 [Smallanthus sonchifolius]|uniref:Uncharacterized protein n=1 Tax=Smallanthus sonchifolius TaxID=185202 RepID=A0ACB9IPS4_9ASTR|nr:hypothetical protein L1987_25476 [Smallanthus sonchifolius]
MRLSLEGQPKTYPVKKFVLEQGTMDKARLDKLKSLLLENLYEEGDGQSGNLYKWDDLKTILHATDGELDSGLRLLSATEIDGYWRIVHYTYMDRMLNWAASFHFT